jgi:hypothetical protein
MEKRRPRSEPWGTLNTKRSWRKPVEAKMRKKENQKNVLSKPGSMVAHTCNPSSLKVEAGGQ